MKWKKIAKMRNKLIHDYTGVDLFSVWGVLKDVLSKLEGKNNKNSKKNRPLVKAKEVLSVDLFGGQRHLFKWSYIMKSMNVRFFSCVFLLYASSVAFSQSSVKTNWVFGGANTHLSFDEQGNGVERYRGIYPITNTRPALDTGGATTITDQFSGNILFYTDGSSGIFDKSHRLITNSKLSTRSSINVPTVGCPVPGSINSEGVVTKYYIFRNANSEIRYSVLDRTLVGNGNTNYVMGGLDPTNRDVSTSLAKPSEGMIIIPNMTGSSFWLISQHRDSFTVKVSQISSTTSSGINTPVSYSFNTSSIQPYEASHFAYHNQTSKLAMAPKGNSGNIWIMNFNSNTGTLTFEKEIPNTGYSDSPNESVYDLEFSDNGTKLYYSRFGETSPEIGNIYQIDLFSSNNSPTTILKTPVYGSYGLQIGNDDKIYHLYRKTSSGSYLLGRIDNPNDNATAIQYNEKPLDTTNFLSRQFSNFSPTLRFSFQTLDFVHRDSCQGNTTKFFPEIIPSPTKVTWNFGDGTRSSALIPVHKYSRPGDYSVSMTAEINGLSQSVTKNISIVSSDFELDIGNDTIICIDEVLKLDAGANGKAVSWVWSTGATTKTIDVDTSGIYWVEAKNASGCTAFDKIEIKEYGLTQTYFNRWYFGNNAGINFTNGPLVLTDAKSMSSSAESGASTITDKYGLLLFYSDGATIWNKNHDIMRNGSNMGINTEGIQQVHIMPFGDDETMFYVFHLSSRTGSGLGTPTSNELNELRYSIVDMKEDIGKGSVVVKGKVLLDIASTGLIPNGYRGTNNFITAHQVGSNSFRSYRVEQQGLSFPKHSTTGQLYSLRTTTASFDFRSSNTSFKFSQDKKLLAVCNPLLSTIEIFDVDTLGVISKPRTISTVTGGIRFQPIDAVFSPSNKKLHVTFKEGSNGSVAQYDLDSLGGKNKETDIANSKFLYGSSLPASGYATIQTGPNFIIYGTVNGGNELFTITNPDGNDNSAGYTEAGFSLNGRTNLNSLPHFTNQYSIAPTKPSMNVVANCLSTESKFTATGRDSKIETYSWDFGDGNSSSEQNPTHTYSRVGSYKAVLTLSNRCAKKDSIFRKTITINPNPATPTTPSDTILCDDPITLKALPGSLHKTNYRYVWSNGDTTREITITTSADLTIEIMDRLTGCSSGKKRVLIADGRPKSTLSPTASVCINTPYTITPTVTNASTFSWKLNSLGGPVIGNSKDLKIDSSQPGVFNYILSLSNSRGCSLSDIIQITVFEFPEFEIKNIQKASRCDSVNASFEIQINSKGDFDYSIVNNSPFNSSEPISGTSTSNNPSIIKIDQVSTGDYTVRLKNKVSGCADTQKIKIGPTCSTEIIAPNAFSPDEKGFAGNEVFYIINNPIITDFEIDIYNRWGEHIYHSNEKKFQWNGRLKNGKILPGVYTYVINYKTRNISKNFVYRGAVTLIR